MVANLETVESGRSVTQKRVISRLRRQCGQAVSDFQMIESGDRIMVCLSGGKDSYTMLDLLLGLQRSAPIDFELIAVNLDQKQPGFPPEVLPRYLRSLGVQFDILEQDTYSVVKRVIPEGKTYCGLCSRLRRGALYTYARENNITKIALGHHRDDLIETLFLNLFHGGRLSSMAAKLRADAGDCVVIRPLAYCEEADIERYAALRDFPIIPCTLCGSQPNSERKEIRRMLESWRQAHPKRLDAIFRSLKTVATSHLLDTEQFDFANLGRVADDPDAANLP